MEKKSHLVYGFKCGATDCNAAYIGETQQTLKARFSQHKRPSVAGDPYNSAIFNHLSATGHKVDLKNVLILDRDENWFTRGIKESIWERVEKPSLNRRGGLRFNLPRIWDRAISKVQRRLVVAESTSQLTDQL